jgi:hypothetical protein
MVFIPVYSIKLHNIHNHFWQSYVNAEGKRVQLSAQVYYSTFLNAICSIYNLEEYPIDLTGFFQDHIDPALQKCFRSHYPRYGQTLARAAITQRAILLDVLNALIKAENDLMNICDIVWVEQQSSK